MGESQHRANRQKQEGNILLTSLLVLVTMNLLGIGMMQSTMQENKTTSYKRIDAMTFQATESCIADAVAWLKSQTRPSDILPYTISENDLSDFYTGDETTEELNQLAGYQYNCTISELITKTGNSEDDGNGEQVGEGDGYGQSGDLSPKFFYRVIASGAGPSDAQKDITALVSVTY